MKNKKIQLIRKKLDKLDLQMLTIIKSSSLLVKKILNEKKFKKTNYRPQELRIFQKNLKRKILILE